MSIDLHPRLLGLLKPYLAKGNFLRDNTMIVEDLGVTGSDFLDLVNDIEQEFSVSMHEFLIGDDPQYISTGLIGWLLGMGKKPVYRDVTVGEINEFLRGKENLT